MLIKGDRGLPGPAIDIKGDKGEPGPHGFTGSIGLTGPMGKKKYLLWNNHNKKYSVHLSC